MVTGVLFLVLALLAALLAAFIYKIATTPVAAVDAPTLVRTRAAQSTPAPELTGEQRRAHASPAGTGASHRLRSQTAVGLAIAGVAAIVVGGWLFLRIADGAAACSHQAVEICSAGFVLLTGSQLAGGAIAIAGIGSVVVASVLALR